MSEPGGKDTHNRRSFIVGTAGFLLGLSADRLIQKTLRETKRQVSIWELLALLKTGDPEGLKLGFFEIKGYPEYVGKKVVRFKEGVRGHPVTTTRWAEREADLYRLNTANGGLTSSSIEFVMLRHKVPNDFAEDLRMSPGLKLWQTGQYTVQGQMEEVQTAVTDTQELTLVSYGILRNDPKNS